MAVTVAVKSTLYVTSSPRNSHAAVTVHAVSLFLCFLFYFDIMPLCLASVCFPLLSVFDPLLPLSCPFPSLLHLVLIPSLVLSLFSFVSRQLVPSSSPSVFSSVSSLWLFFQIFAPGVFPDLHIASAPFGCYLPVFSFPRYLGLVV